MTAKTKTQIKAFFETGDKPTEDQFIDMIDSYVDSAGPIGTLEAAASAHSGTGFTNWSTGTPTIGDASTTRSNLGLTVYTTALASGVAVDSCRPVFMTTGQATSTFVTTAQASAIAADVGGGGSVTVNNIGAFGGGTQDINLVSGKAVTATIDSSAATFTFSNPAASGTEDGFTLYLTNGASRTVTWPSSVIWAGSAAPTLTSGKDTLVFTTTDGGTVWYGFDSGLGMG
jgi:hypothetical protein